MLLLVTFVMTETGLSQDGTREELDDRAERLKDVLKKFPESDADQNGVLTQAEAIAFFRDRREKVGRLAESPRRKGIEPTHADIRYGNDEKQAVDIWVVPGASQPTPLVLFIHGGGFRSGDKGMVRADVIEKYLNEGIAFAAMNYRLSDVGPYPIMMEDCARGLQTIRHRAAEWNIDPKKVACYGGSAGAGISLWLGFHDDLADPKSEDPIARQSTRVSAVGSMNGQSTYDINDFRKWFDLPDLQPDAALPAFYGIGSEADWESERVRKLMVDASSINHLTKDDVPVYMIYSRPNTVVTEKTSSREWVHHVKLGLKLNEAMKALNLECIVRGPDVIPEEDPYGSLEDFLIRKLTSD